MHKTPTTAGDLSKQQNCLQMIAAAKVPGSKRQFAALEMNTITTFNLQTIATASRFLHHTLNPSASKPSDPKLLRPNALNNFTLDPYHFEIAV